MPRPTIVAIDGPAGAGKSTVARALAERLGFTLVDTGAIYRAVALSATRAGIPFDDDAGLMAIVDGLEVDFHLEDGLNHVLLAGEDVTPLIRTPEISMGASTVSARPAVRTGLLELQRRLALETEAEGAVLEGRDIGTVVFPDADHKFFLTASAEIRARRRYDELTGPGGRGEPRRGARRSGPPRPPGLDPGGGAAQARRRRGDRGQHRAGDRRGRRADGGVGGGRDPHPRRLTVRGKFL